MTEEEKSVLRKLKSDVVADLNRLLPLAKVGHRVVFDSDSRLLEYVEKNVNNPTAHNLYELLSVRRFLTFLDKYDFRIDEFTQFVRLYEALKFSGTHGRTHYKLTPIQVFQYANIYGFYIGDVRLCRNAYIIVPRKFSKTTSAAAMAINELFFGEHNAQAYCCANSFGQAKILFDEIRNILLSIDPNETNFKVNRETVSWKNGRESFCRCLASNPKALDGLFASLCICDEYSQARNTAGKNGADLKNTITSSMGPRKSPLTVIITTASEVVDGPCAHELEGVKAVLRGEMENDRVFASLFMPDVDDKEDDPNTWAKVQPHMGITVQPDFYAEEYKNALLSAENMMVFRTKLLNIFAMNDEACWITPEVVKQHLTSKQLTDYDKRHDAMIAIDLAESDDFSAVTTAVYQFDTKTYYFHTAYFFPRGALEGHRNKRMYEIWAEQGYLTLTEGDVIDYEVIVNYVLDINKYCKTIKIGYDSWKSKEVINRLETAIGFHASHVLTPIPQTYGPFNAPVEVFEHGLKTGKIEINDNPINLFCFANAVIDVDNMDNKKPIKRGTGRGHQNTNANKIDGVITMLMCERLFIDAKR